MTAIGITLHLEEDSHESRRRGESVLRTIHGIRNVRIAGIADHVRTLLDSGIWRDYVLPNGRAYSWEECEFDYFLMATDLDPVLIDQAVRASGDRKLCLDLAAACQGPSMVRRRLTDILTTHPELEGRLVAVDLGGQLRKVVSTRDARDRYLAGASPSNAGNTREWFTVGWAAGTQLEAQADHIARRLLSRDPELAKAVVRALGSTTSGS